MSWILPCNKKFFDIHSAFQDMEYINWDIGNIKMEIGDSAYIYIAAPEKAIRYKCIITDLSDYKEFDDSAYGGDPTGYRANQATLKFIEMYTEPGIRLDQMKELGINKRFSMQSIIKMPEKLEEYINQLESAANEDENISDLEEEDLKRLKGYEREAVIRARVNQSKFRDRLLEKNRSCCLCGVDQPDLLIASHIKPWRVSDEDEKTDLYNGLLLCPNHDRLFDSGYITFNDDGSIIISSELSEAICTAMGVDISMKVEIDDKTKEYMQYHREHIFRK